ncbi:MAG: radical SAM protein [Chlorobiaceae bacterium]|nr:radical SAM protein [Chlorobiaceae bacterium]MBA4309941.1 radical SAM protein [Chlorobiaceae bacterium]
MIDTHAHLFWKDFEADLDQVIERAKENGINYIIVPSTDLKTAEKVIELANKYDIIYGAVGVHPHDTKEWNKNLLPEFRKLTEHNKIIAIGEIGLDYYYDFSPREIQIEAFRSQLELAIELDLPVIVHNRESDKDIMEIISSYCGSGLKAQFHCYNGNINDAIELIKMNHFISFTGNITFKKFDSLREVVSKIPLENILLETDSPFMTPVPFRGKRNEPANVKIVAEQIAAIHKISLEELIRITDFNAFKLFGLGKNEAKTFTYRLGNSLYINVTNRCNANCTFCDRKGVATINHHNLKLKKSEEPSAEVYIKEINDPKKYDEIVFCGYGEPTLRWNVVKEIAKYVKDNGGVTRINTNGHGNLINKKNITEEMNGLIDTVSISLNSTTPKQYSELMQLDESFFYEMIDFTKKAKANVKNVVMSVVSIKDVDIESARNFAEKEVGVNFRIRNYF